MLRLAGIVGVMLLLLALPGAGKASPAGYQLYTAAGRPLTVATAAGLLADYDVVIFGEYHDNAVLHSLESALLAKVLETRPRLAVSLEMFERDVQPQLDDYLAGRITEPEFLAGSRPWNNYREAYRPLVEFAKEHSLPVLAANIPRPLAAHYAREGSLVKIAAAMAGYLPEIHTAPPGEYRQKFMAYMTDSAATARMPVDPDRLENYYKAQCLKDDTMAESIARFSRLRPDYQIIHYQGDFHSRWRLGVVEKLQFLNPALKVAVIAPVYVETLADAPRGLAQNQNAGDILVIVEDGTAH